MSESSVIVDDLSKLYRLYPDPQARLKELLCLGKKKFHVEKWALRHINFELQPGQALGVIGINGAGKSTLLKILTGTSRQTSGRYVMNGKVASLLELGAGFHSDFSGRENIYMNAAIQGVPRAEVDRQYEAIAAFSELGAYLEHPVRTYSSGMAMRLGFSASMLLDPDILILDEVLAVGDAHFQRKCMDVFTRYRRADKTILFVSHSAYHVREICDRAIWIHDGNMVMDDDPITVTDEYENHLLAWRAQEAADRGLAIPEAGVGLAKVQKVEVFSGDADVPSEELSTHDAVRVRVRFRNPESERSVLPIVALLRNDGLLVTSSRPIEPVPGRDGESVATLVLPRLPLLSGEFTVTVYLTDETGVHVVDQAVNAAKFKVSRRGIEKGIFLADGHWVLDGQTVAAATGKRGLTPLSGESP